MDDFREMFYETNTGGKIPSGLPGGFFIYEAGGDEKILFAETNVVKLYGCETYEDFLEYTQGSFKNMVHPDDLNKIENQIQAQTIFGEQRHDYVRYRIKTKQGEVRYIEDFGHLLHWHCGKSFYYVFIVDVLKLDLIFMRNLKNNPKTGTLMNFIVKGATSMGLSTLCEGVESDEQLEFLKKIGCNRAQRYLFGKPMPMDESRAHTSEKGLAWEN